MKEIDLLHPNSGISPQKGRTGYEGETDTIEYIARGDSQVADTGGVCEL